MSLTIPDVNSLTANDWIRALELEPHPEGGYYRETHRSGLDIPGHCLPEGFGGPRSASTAIYYLLEGGEFSAFHRIRADELWHFHSGSSLLLHMIMGDGEFEARLVGCDLQAGARPQAVVPAGTWFAASVAEPSGYGLAGCTVAPGFDFDDFEMGRRAALVDQFPAHRDIIETFTRD